MSFSQRTTLLSTVCAGLLGAVVAIAPVTPLHAGEPPDDPDTPAPADPTAGDADDPDAVGEEEEEEKPKPIEIPDTGGWGRGGEEPEGKYKPQGKTGKLKELEDDEQERIRDAEEPAELPPAGYAYLDTAFGFGDIRVVAHETDLTNITPTVSFLVGVGYRIGRTWELGIRYGISTGINNGPNTPTFAEARDPDSYTQIASGGIELAVKPHFELSRTLRLPIGLALTIPIGEGDTFAAHGERQKIGKVIVQEAAAASRGYEDRALFVHNRFGIGPSVGILFDKELGPGKLHVAAGTKAEIMVRTGGEEPPTGEQLGDGEAQGELQDAAVSWTLGGGVFYDFFGGLLSPGVRMWLAVATSPEIKGSVDPNKTSFVFEPNIRTHIPFTSSKKFGIDARVAWTLPTGTVAGDDSSIWGQRVTAGFFF